MSSDEQDRIEWQTWRELRGKRRELAALEARIHSTAADVVAVLGILRPSVFRERVRSGNVESDERRERWKAFLGASERDASQWPSLMDLEADIAALGGLRQEVERLEKSVEALAGRS